MVLTSPGFVKASRANTPPSPRLSARSMLTRYLKETRKVRLQKISERIPLTFSGVRATRWVPEKHSFKAYRGLVPMSPNTTPSAEKDRTPSALPVGSGRPVLMRPRPGPVATRGRTPRTR